MPLSRLVYYSTNTLRSRGTPLQFDLKLILTSAISHNSADGVTGGLVFNRSYFLQVLEGEGAAVDETFARISEDPRHRNIVLVETKPVSERLFGRWSMGYAGKSELFETLCARYCGGDTFNPAGMSGDELANFILELVSGEENVASTADIAAA